LNEEPPPDIEESQQQQQFKINKQITDEEFKSNYDPMVIQRKTTLALKTSFHLINTFLMGLCQVFLSGQEEAPAKEGDFKSSRLHTVDFQSFLKRYKDLCIYEIEEGEIQILEHAPGTFRAIRA